MKILFLGYGQEKTNLIDKLMHENCEVWHTEDKIKSISTFDLVISYGYRHIITGDILNNAEATIINLHISYLPWNRGTHPNFWSFYDGTPSGVSIHLLDEGIDTGPIICQKIVKFDSAMLTFEETYVALISELENLFLQNLKSILSNNFIATPQMKDCGSYHSQKDLPKEFLGWHTVIRGEIKRLRQLQLIFNKV
jgi:methionyl-tRNA formyltransferase